MSARRWVSMWAPRRQYGATSVEFFITFIVAISFIMGVMQLGMFFVAKNTVNLATFAAARAGAASGGDRGQMKQAFAKALSGLYVAKGLRLAGSNGATDVSAGNFETVITGATAWGFGLAGAPYDQMDILNPRRAAFTDFGVPDPAGGRGRIIPVTGLVADTQVGASSRQTRADALLLKLEVRHCYEMIFPVIDVMVSKAILSNPLGIPFGDIACYRRHPSLDGRMVYGVVVVSQAVVRMTTPPIQSNFK